MYFYKKTTQYNIKSVKAKIIALFTRRMVLLMSDNIFTPLMGEFLRNLAAEMENNKALARRMAEPFQAVTLEALANSGMVIRSRTGSNPSKQKKYPIPDGFDPFRIFNDIGSPGLYNHLLALGVDELKGILAHFTNLPRQEYVRKQKQEILAQMIVQTIGEVIAGGAGFGNITENIPAAIY